VAVTIKKNNITEISASGILVGIDDFSIKVEDEKTGLQELEIDLLKEFLGKEIRLKISNKENA
jgi:small nuclear ribonucleoprotein (snRNP)-like protein